MENEQGFTNIHFVIAAIFAVTVALGSFAGVQALTSMDDGELSDVTGQEGIKMDVEIGSTFNFEAQYRDGDGTSGTEGRVVMENINPDGALDLLGITVDADAGVGLGTTATTGGAGAIVIGMPDIPSGIIVGAINPAAGTSASFDTNTTTTQSIGSVGVGGVNNGSAVEVQIGAN